jgi:hypothetical protein
MLVQKFIYSEAMTKILTSILVVVVALAIAFSIYSSKPQALKLKDIASLVENDSVFTSRYSSQYDASDLKENIHQLAKSEGLLKQSMSDSIQLVINLKDSVAILAIKGVTIHSAKFNSIEIDPIFEYLTNRQYLWLFGTPSEMQNLNTTIIKEPIVVREAPKDTLEAALNAATPDTLIQNPAYLYFTMRGDFRVNLEQVEELTEEEEQFMQNSDQKNPSSNVFQQLISFCKWETKQYTPTITVMLPKNEIRAIYRALPTRPTTVVIL